MPKKLINFSAVATCCLLLPACEQMQMLAKKAGAAAGVVEEFTETPGTKAFEFLAPTFKDRAVKVDAILEALGVTENEVGNASLRLQGLTTDDSEDIAEVSEDGLDLMESGRGPKSSFDNEAFKKLDDDFFTQDPVEAGFLMADSGVDHSSDTVNWTYAKDSFTVSSLDKLPVRDQGQRGTCAAHAGIAQLESYLIKKYSLNSIDLSEQRFYYMSKPDTWTTGGDVTKEGSNSGTGFAKSYGYEYESKTYPPGSPTDFNIPMETNCPYKKEKGTNDTQYPQAKGCETGVAKVTDFRAWLYKYDERVSSAQDIYDMLVEKDMPVIVASKLSDNFENNDGMVTLAASGGAGATSHAAGHAYLIVGAKKIDEAKFPDEGGMCFLIRNSWGRGWGVDGISCVTLAWFNTWRYPNDFDQLVEAVLDTTKFAEAKEALNTKPTDVAEADDSAGKVEKKTTGTRRGAVSFLHGSSLAGDRKLGALVDEENRFWKVLYSIADNKVTIYGILDGDKKVTQGLELSFDDGKLSDEFESKGSVTVGELDEKTGIFTLCAVKYGQVCDLNYVEEFQQLVVGLTKNEFNRQDSQGPYEWKSLGIGGQSIDFSSPGKGTSVDIRLTSKGTTTNPLRFTLEPLSGLVSYQGQSIGSILKPSLCSGDYGKVCRVVKSGEKFAVLFKSKDQ
jgi:C1A family cysteine protease